ncbi:hypothetical protein [Streptomyces sp. NPDC005795]|uniref:Imm32 family immunity protein n=1 Tax=Streptomyces sp. NPDC005795 TaxID=3154677 RepID=UPI0034110962
MRVWFLPDGSGVDVSGGTTELVVMARALVAGKGCVETTASAEASFGGTELASVEVVSTNGPGALIRVDMEHRVLFIEGDRLGLTALADEVRSIAEMNDGGHQHIEYFPGHYYLAAGSVPMVVTSPQGGMPSR